MNAICVEKSNKPKKSKVKRLNFLPRIGLTIDFAGTQITYRQAPILETVVNLFDRGFSMKNLMDVSFEQLQEISLTKLNPCEEAAAPTKPKKVTKKATPRKKPAKRATARKSV